MALPQDVESRNKVVRSKKVARPKVVAASKTVARPKAVVRPRVDFDYDRGDSKEVAPKPGFQGCYLFAHKADARSNSPKKQNVYSLVLYVDVDAGPITYTMNDDGDGVVVDVRRGCTLDEVAEAVKRCKWPGSPGSPEPPPGSVTIKP